MEMNDITLDQLNEVVSVMEDYNREPQKLSEVLPLVLVILKAKVKDMVQSQKDEKFYAPSWVNALLNKLSAENAKPLPNEERYIFRDMVSRLSFDDYKPATPGLFGYEVQYATPQQISETILALKNYFGVI